ncbi:serine/threonine protein kinase [Rippkaea orientalis PCC 8801]|uniref:non-specific serine/threonine protein kinase n=1 Tax=Rippkaea orientalis (strain PCC 8801 / RF-1) TaxID=41431 RepID=B7K0F5_RIPO1|nr:bifunctional serine/threonine-protein kinase/ABC transporter substrate-binding protein [Rippkaea orientalis]ACK67439.1 serine/threonine protein kinase [Rippkaea orientalis PCC 8801]
MSLNPGDIFHQHYKIISQLGVGGFGRTYQAQDLANPKHPLCVVKEIIQPQSSDPKILQEVEKRFLREGKTLARLGEHPQIPRLFEYFSENNKFYLIQEYIDGHDLSQEIGTGCLPLSETEVKQLLQDTLEVLSFVHQQHIIHRDIKPSNLRRRKKDGKIVLLDFGAVKEIGTMAATYSEASGGTIAIGTPGYMSAEQQSGQPQLNSDLYSLGMICIQGLTGVHPRALPTDPSTGDVIWRYATADRPIMSISPELERILMRMVRYMFSDRYYSAVEALEDLRQMDNSSLTHPQNYQPTLAPPTVNSLPQKRRGSPQIWWGIGVTSLLLGMGIIITLIPKTCAKVIGDNLSCGEEILSKSIALPEKQEGVKSYLNGRYQEAVEWLEKARKKELKDPETLIYLNNARLKVDGIPFYTIAVAIPLGNPADGGDSGKEILRGVAQLQTAINSDRGINGHGLRVVISDDFNDTGRAKNIAEKLSNQGQVLGVVGHYTSDSTRSVLPIYEMNNLLLISPTSTAESLTENHPLFFRTIPRDRVNAEALVDYLYDVAKQKKAMVFYNPNSAYSRSLHERFLIRFDEKGGQVVKQFDLSNPIFNAEEAIRQGENRQGTSIVLFPDAKSNPYAFPNALKVIRANQGRYLMVGGDSLYTTDILQERELSNGLVVAISWHYLSSSNQFFAKEAKKMWDGNISSRTAMSYDAALVMAIALKEKPKLDIIQKLQSIFNPNIERNALYKSLKRPNFETKGATGKISFELSGDRAEKVVELVKVVPSKCSPYGYMFVLAKYKSAQEAGITCN